MRKARNVFWTLSFAHIALTLKRRTKTSNYLIRGRLGRDNLYFVGIDRLQKDVDLLSNHGDFWDAMYVYAKQDDTPSFLLSITFDAKTGCMGSSFSFFF